MLRFLTAGESHGEGLTVIVEGVPAGLPIAEEQINCDLARRQQGYGRGGRMLIEKDQAHIVGGVRHGFTLGSPIALFIANRDWPNWGEQMSITPVEAEIKTVTRLRPGHADLTGALKYGQHDVRNILERASARETAARVAAGAVARRLLQELGITVRSHTVSIGATSIEGAEQVDWSRVEDSPLRCGVASVESAMTAAIDHTKAKGDTIGGTFEIQALGVPVGLGSHVHWDRRLNGRLAQAVMSIHAVRGVEIGDGFRLAAMPGSQAHDVIALGSDGGRAGPWHHLTNHAGGIEGGITNGEIIVVRAVIKPIPTLPKPLPSVDLLTGEPVNAHYERSDVCVVPAAGVVGEAMVALVLAEACLEKFGGDHLQETQRNLAAYLSALPRPGQDS
ncbi:MAG: chorismate synthase [Chloroflexota bacterium]|nr:MAG: chorismate synthase [Chloroflexota bacterium]